MARIHGDYFGIEKQSEESDTDYRQRVAGELRRAGRIIEAHEALSGRRWDSSGQDGLSPVTGIVGALLQELNGDALSADDPKRQVGDDIATGIIVERYR